MYAFEAAASFNSLKPIFLTKVVTVIRIIVAVIPLICMICITTYDVLSRMRKMKVLGDRLNAGRRGYLNVEMDFAENLPDRLLNPEHYNQENLQKPESRDEGTQTCTVDTY